MNADQAAAMEKVLRRTPRRRGDCNISRGGGVRPSSDPCDELPDDEGTATPGRARVGRRRTRPATNSPTTRGLQRPSCPRPTPSPPTCDELPDDEGTATETAMSNQNAKAHLRRTPRRRGDCNREAAGSGPSRRPRACDELPDDEGTATVETWTHSGST